MKKREQLKKITGFTVPELSKEIRRVRLELGKVAIEVRARRTKNAHAKLTLRRNLARLLTILRIKEKMHAEG